MILMYILWLFIPRPGLKTSPAISQSKQFCFSDFVDINIVDLSQDEYQDIETDREEDERTHNRVMEGSLIRRILWRLYYLVA